MTDNDQHAVARGGPDAFRYPGVQPDLTADSATPRNDTTPSVSPGPPVVTDQERSDFLVALHSGISRAHAELGSHGFDSPLLEDRLDKIEATLRKQHPATWAARHDELIDRNSELWHIPDGYNPEEACRICDRGLPNQIHPDDLPRPPR